MRVSVLLLLLLFAGNKHRKRKEDKTLQRSKKDSQLLVTNSGSSSSLSDPSNSIGKAQAASSWALWFALGIHKRTPKRLSKTSSLISLTKGLSDKQPNILDQRGDLPLEILFCILAPFNYFEGIPFKSSIWPLIFKRPNNCHMSSFRLGWGSKSMLHPL